VATEVKLSHVSKYGNESFNSEPIGEFQAEGDWAGALRRSGLLGRTRRMPTAEASAARRTSIDSRSASLHSLVTRYQRAAAGGAEPAVRDALNAQVQAELASQARFDAAFAALAASELGEPSVAAALAAPMPADFDAWACYAEVNDAMGASACGGMTDYGLKYGRLIARMCHASGGATAAVVDAVGRACEAAAA
jgi:hypothetical protein